MELRDRVFAMAGRRLLGETFAQVAKLLPEHRQAAVMSALETLRVDRVISIRDRYARRVSRLARKRYGAAWDLIDPRVAQTVLLHGRKQDH